VSGEALIWWSFVFEVMSVMRKEGAIDRMCLIKLIIAVAVATVSEIAIKRVWMGGVKTGIVIVGFRGIGFTEMNAL
jgi:hypothetical protein